MYHLMLKEHKFVDGTHVMLRTYKGEWRVYVNLYKADLAEPTVGIASIGYEAYETEEEARKAYAALNSYAEVEAFYSHVDYTF